MEITKPLKNCSVPILLDDGILVNDEPIPPITANHDKDEAAIQQELELTTKSGSDDAVMPLFLLIQLWLRYRCA